MKKLLIANRGEIAIRIMRTAREMGIRTVAVYSDADQRALHPQFADEAVHIGGSLPAESYLRTEAILKAAKQTSTDAVHPGYGFLSERASFSEACETAGLTFVGPPASAMRMLGSKIEAKQLATRLGVPITPGYFEPGASPERLLEEAKKIGFPVMLKASAGGGGRGMRPIHDQDHFLQQCELATQEALNAFGDGAMMVEKLIERPQHVEVQIIADRHGNVAPLFERECSIQRRHQKLIEEAPCVTVQRNPELWETLKNSAVRLAETSGYVGAGTVEFILDPATLKVYFLEVNARLQVEHPVTEFVTGLDIVRLQIEIARGANLTDVAPEFLTGSRNNLQGHSIEVRIVAEDPSRGFAPSIGPILAWAEPKGPGIRVDSGFGPGGVISQFYDSLIAKVIVSGSTRAAAIQRLTAALKDFHILGVKTNIPFLLEVLRHESFMNATADTHFVDDELAEWNEESSVPPELSALYPRSVNQTASQADASSERASETAWASQDRWRVHE